MNSLGVCCLSIICHLSNISIKVIGLIVDMLDTSIRKSYRVGSLTVAVSIIRFCSLEVGSRVVISYIVLVGVGRDLIRVNLSNSMSNNSMSNQTMSSQSMSNQTMSSSSHSNGWSGNQSTSSNESSCTQSTSSNESSCTQSPSSNESSCTSSNDSSCTQSVSSNSKAVSSTKTSSC